MTTINGHRVLLMKPQTFMNASGDAVKEAADFYKIDPEHIIVISDDIYLAPGRVRVRKSGSHGGQKGLKSITEQLASENFPRIRIGVGEKPNPDYPLATGFSEEYRRRTRRRYSRCSERYMTHFR